VVGVRSLQSQLPSGWQERVKVGERASLDEWLTSLFEAEADPTVRDRPPALETDRVVERWTQRVGAENVAVVVISNVGRSLLDVFETMLALNPGTLQLSTDPRAGNRGLTAEEAEMLRLFNAQVDRSAVTFADYRWSSGHYCRYIQSRPARGSKVTLPNWAVPTIQRIAEGHVQALADSGVHIVGDLNDLLPRPVDETRGDAGVSLDPAIQIEVGVAAMLASLEQHIAERTQPVHPLKQWTPPVFLDPARRVRSGFRSALPQRLRMRLPR
jgi:hypothetical protein